MPTCAARAVMIAALAFATGCATAPAAVAPPITPEQKMSWIIRLEDQRLLRDPSIVPPPAVTNGRRAVVAPPVPDLIALLGDAEARIRRRAALGVGRVGLAEGVPPLVALLDDVEPEVGRMAAFALGLIGSREAVAPLVAALEHPAMIVRGAAAEGLGLIGDPAAADPIAALAATLADDPAVQALDADNLAYPLDATAEAFRSAVFALARLDAYEALAAAVLAPDGAPRVTWWPVAYALQRVEDPRAIPALRALAATDGHYAVAFAMRGLGALKDASSNDRLIALLEHGNPHVVVSAVRALAAIGAAAAVEPLARIVSSREYDAALRREALEALGELGSEETVDLLLDMLGSEQPALRATALRALARADSALFITVLSGLDPDPHWSVRAALAETLGTLEPSLAMPRLTALLDDNDQRVLPAVLASLRRLAAPGIVDVLLAHLQKGDPVVRMAAARELGEVKPPEGVVALRAAYEAAAGDTTYVARAAMLGALAAYGTPEAMDVVRAGLRDRDWGVRVRAAQLLEEHGATGALDLAAAIRPAPTTRSAAAYEEPALVAPTVTPHVYIETDKGTVQIELAVLDAPLTTRSLMTLARSGFFDGLAIHRVVPNFVVQAGDPRGDGEGGPGYTLRDELNMIPYMRGTVGMALDWPDTGGSQFFITHSPQPHLNGRYTAFGRVITGMEVVDRLEPWDVIRRMWVWDGTTPPPASE